VSTPEPGTRDGMVTADSSAAADAWAEREARMGADIAAMHAGPTEHAAGLTDHHQGLPTVETQMHTHGQAPPRVPDTGGHG
jgi:hypothetical protein